jgi:hypothetical protein
LSYFSSRSLFLFYSFICSFSFSTFLFYFFFLGFSPATFSLFILLFSRLPFFLYSFSHLYIVYVL